jgi:TetR/AcrR family transcriptional regulator of autoinduction and epiphytic fitness
MAQAGHRRATPAASNSDATTAAAAPESTTQRILAAATVLFLTAGYDGVNLEQVAERAGVARQTLYNKFGSKEALFRAVVERHWTLLRFEEILRLPSTDPQDDPETTLRRFASSLVAFVSDTEQIAFTRLVVAESRRLPWIAEEFYRLGKQPLLAALTALLAQLTEAQLLACPEPEVAAHQFLGLVQEFVVWPKVMAIGAPVAALPPTEVVINEALLTFLSRYRRP